MKSTLLALVIGFVLAVGGIALGARWLGASHYDSHTLSVTGEARLVGEPDMARIRFGVEKSGKTVVETQKRMSEVISKVIAVTQKLGVKKEDIATSDINITQGWDYKKRAPRGYTISSTLTITARNVQHVGDIIDTAIAGGLNRMEGVSYDVRSPEWRKKALREALDKARQKADAMAASVGRPLGRVISVREGYESQASPADEYDSNNAFRQLRTLGYLSERRESMPMTRSLPGQRALTVSVEVVYEI